MIFAARTIAMRATATPSPLRTGRQRLLTSCAIAAGIAALAHGGPALAQVAGSGSFVSGTGTIGNDAGTNTTTVNVDGAQSIIDWVPTDTAPTGGAIDFLPAGENWNFAGSGDYTVLNRFVNGGGGSLSRQIALNGTVNSVDTAASGARGGNIWFYNAGGILIGASGVINVGSLLLTTNDIVTTGGLFGPTGAIRLGGASGSTSAITVNGAINADKALNAGNAYVALVAPRVVQAGAVRVDGSAAYVAAEQAEIRINPGNGLFDINVTVGAEGGDVITHSGTTTGPAHQQGDIDQSRIYMVAIPKNDAVTMLVSGAIGYDDALSAQVDPDGAVRLSAGYNIVDGELAALPANATAANITAGDTLFRSDTVARASGAFAAAPAQLLPGSPPPLSSAGQFFVEGSGTFIGDVSALVSIGANQSGGASGAFTVESGGRAGTPGNAAINVTGGTLSASGGLTIQASGAPDALTGDSQGGTAALTITGGSVTAAGVTVEANGVGDLDAGGTSGNGRGGSASVSVSGAGSTLAAGNIFINAIGSGDNNVDGTPAVSGGGTGTGGGATFTQTGGTVSVGDVRVAADGLGGYAQGVSGTGIGGAAAIDLSGGTLTAADIVASADGEGGVGVAGDDFDPLNIIASGDGGLGRGGTATISIDGTATVDAGVIRASALGAGGEGGRFDSFFTGVPGTPGNAGDGIGGNATVNVRGGATNASSLTADASGVGGAGGDSFFSSSGAPATGVGVGGSGGAGRGGTATLALETAIDGVGAASSIAAGSGGAGGAHNVGGDGGDGVGGAAQAIVAGFAAGALALTVDSTGTGGNGADGNDGAGGSGGNGTGGTSRISAGGAGTTLTVVESNLVSGGVGGNGGAGRLGFSSFPAAAPAGGNGGDGRGGTIEIAANEGGLVSLGLEGGSDSVLLSSSGRGGAGGLGSDSSFGAGNQSGDGGDGGAGTGGTVRLVATGGRITSNGEAVDIGASGLAGEGGSGGTGQGGGSDGGLGDMGQTSGGRVVIETALGAMGPGAIDLGPTSIAANGDSAGRIELRAAGAISFAGLDAEAFGIAAPTNNDTDSAPAGIFVAPAGGTIASQGDVTLATGGSVGVHAQSNGIFDVDGILTIDAGDQIDIRHDARQGTAATLRASDSLIATAATSISGAPGSLIAADGALSLSTGGTIGVDRLAGGDIALASTGAARVEHAEAANDFSANAASFATGINSIITGGDISIVAAGAVDLGNSSAGGFVQVSGQSIAFNSIDAGLTVGLTANGTAPGAEGIDGGSIAAGGDISLFANRIALGGRVTGDASFFAFGTGGTVSVSDADVAGTISIFAADGLSGRFVAGGNIFLNSDGSIDASAQANGGYVDGNGIATDGNLFVIAAGDAALTDSSAARMFGVSAGGAASVEAGAAGEDMLVVAGTTARLSDVSAGDDVTVRAPGDIDAANVSTTGAGADTHMLGLSSGSGSPIFTIGVGDGGGADIAFTSTSGTIDAAALSAADDISLDAANVTLAALAGSAGSAIRALDAGGDVVVNSAAAIAGGGIRALGDVALTGATGIDVEEIAALGATSLDSSDGDIRIGNLLASGPITASADAIRVEGGGDLAFTTLTTDVGDAYVRTSGDLSLASATIAGGFDAGALGSLGITGVVTGQSIALASADIMIGSAGRIGTAGVTQQLSVANNDSGNQTFIGGAPGTSVAGYHIDADELARLYGSQIDIVAPAVQAGGGSSLGPTAPPDAIVDGFAMTGGASGSNLGANGALTIRTPGRMRVVGNVELTGLTDANALNLAAGEALEVILGQGSVRLVNGADPAGQLNLASDEIIVATADAIADVGAATSTSAINARLEQNDGVLLDEGALFARGIRAEVAGGFYVQNSGAGTEPARRRGLTFGAGGLDVVTAGPSRIIVNGVQLGPNGQVTGLDALRLLTIGGAVPVAGRYDRGSTVNGCLLASPTVCATILFDNNFPVQDVIEEIEGDEDGAGEGNSLPQPLITLRQIDPPAGAPLLDDPVTGAGNDDLWTPPAE
jgi:hypothetical protein